MIEKEAALGIILGAVPEERRVEEVPLELAPGRVLARDATSDTDLPPFEKSSMDGWAVRAGDVAAAPVELRVLGSIHAGEVAPAPVRAGETWKIMTGAPLPEGADAVVQVEDSEPVLGTRVRLLKAARAGQNVCHRGEDVRAGEVVIHGGTLLDAADIGLLASIGVDPVGTFAPPSVCVIPTGDELVPANGPKPAPGRIRESNGALLEAQVRRVSSALQVVRPGIARDSRESLARFLDVGLGHDVLVLSGGVSMGDLDLVGIELKARGLKPLVEKVAIKPGKPLLFGFAPRKDGGSCAVFGLPGNPVSSFVTFELFVRPFLLSWLGLPAPSPETVQAALRHEGPLRLIPRTQHIPAVLDADGASLVVTPIAWHGSGDLRGVVDANAFIVVPPEGPAPNPGDLVDVQRIAGRPLGPRRRPSRA